MVAGAIEELLLRHRALIDAAIRPLEENTLIDDFLNDLETRVAALQQQEPFFWELRVVQYIHQVVTAELTDVLRNKVEDTAHENETCRVSRAIHDRLEEQLQNLIRILDHDEHHVSQANEEHFLEAFWENVTQSAAVESKELRSAEDAESDEDHVPENSSYEVTTMDDLQFEGGSVNSAPSTEEIPIILKSFGDASSEERSSALHSLSQISALELTHCMVHFHEIITGLADLLVDTDEAIARDAARLVYDILNHVDDSSQFLDVYLTVVDMVGVNVASGLLAIDATALLIEETQTATTKATDVFRLLHLLMMRVPHHWIHFSHESLARVICSTFVVLLLDPSSSSDRKNTWRPVNVLALIDPEASWITKWILRTPSRAQLFASLDESGFVADIMQTMTRVRPFAMTMAVADLYEKGKVFNMLSILVAIATCQPGRDLLRHWTKLPAHLHLQRRYASWPGVAANSFELTTNPLENDRFFHFRRDDGSASSRGGDLELEDGERLGECALAATTLSAIVILLLQAESTSHEEKLLSSLARKASRSMPTGQPDFVKQLLMLVNRCWKILGEEDNDHQASSKPSEQVELEDDDPWFPFRRPRATTTVVELVCDAITKRLVHGRLTLPCVKKRLTSIFGSLLDTAAHVPSLEPTTTAVLAQSVALFSAHCGNSNRPEDGSDTVSIMRSTCRILERAPFTFGSLLCEPSNPTLLHLARLTTSKSTLPECDQDAVFELVLAMASTTAMVPALVAAGLWRHCQRRLLEKWQQTGALDLRIVQLLATAEASQMFFTSEMVQAALQDLQSACSLQLDITLALNSSPSESPYRLRHLSKTLASLRSALATPHSARLLGNDSAKWTRLLAEATTNHIHGVCCATPQREDWCTMVFDMATAFAGCVPSMVAYYDLLARHDVRPLEPDRHDDGISACSFLSSSVASSLAHTGGNPRDWERPRPLHEFRWSGDAVDTTTTTTTTTAAPAPITTTRAFTSQMTCTLHQMLTSIQETKLNDTPLDMVMISQATWELIGDIERVFRDTPDPNSGDHLLLTRAFGSLIFELVKSGKSKIKGETSGNEMMAPQLSAAAAQTVLLDSFPSDSEKKLMNTYYKDYCLTLGLKSSPTTLHVLVKIFGRAAMDCFPISMLMILDQTNNEQELIECLQYCASCPGVGALWPRAAAQREDEDEDGGDLSLAALLPLAQAAEMILEAEFPQVFQTLRHCHCSVLTLVMRWHTQCHWNFLTWENTLMMIYLNFLYGIEFQVYLFVAIIKHVEPAIRETTAKYSGDPARAFVEVLQMPIERFQFMAWRNLFLRLRSTYHDRVRAMLHR